MAEPILRAVRALGYTVATPIQAAAIPSLLAGRDVLGIAETGTGKTAAFALPILQQPLSRRSGAVATQRWSSRRPASWHADRRRVAVLAPHPACEHVVDYGGVSRSEQARALPARRDIWSARRAESTI